MQEGPCKLLSFMIQFYKASSQSLTQTTIWPGWLLQVTQNKCPNGLSLNSGEDQQSLLQPCVWISPGLNQRSGVTGGWRQRLLGTAPLWAMAFLWEQPYTPFSPWSPPWCSLAQLSASQGICRFLLGATAGNQTTVLPALPAIPSILFSSSAGTCYTSVAQGLGPFLFVFCPFLIQNLVQMFS